MAATSAGSAGTAGGALNATTTLCACSCSFSVQLDFAPRTNASMSTPRARCQDSAGSTRTTKRIPDIVATDQYGTTTAYDVMITHPTGRTAAAHKPLHAAAKGERGKQAGYDAHKAKCRALGSTDPGLDVPLIPLLFETYGAAGKNMQGFLRGMVRSYSTQFVSGGRVSRRLLPHLLLLQDLGRGRVRHGSHRAPCPPGGIGARPFQPANQRGPTPPLPGKQTPVAGKTSRPSRPRRRFPLPSDGHYVLWV